MLGLLLCSINFDTLTFVTKLSLNLPTDQKLTFLIAAGILFHKNFAFALQKKTHTIKLLFQNASQHITIVLQ